MEDLSKEAQKYLVTKDFLKQAVLEPNSDSHKNQNGKILVVGGSPLFHGAGRMSARAAAQIVLAFASRTNDMVYFCSTKENIDYLKGKQEAFIGITREQLDFYLPHSDVVLIGPGLMREPQVNMPQTEKEPAVTLELTRKVLASDKKAVLDAGSVQVITPKELERKEKVIITPHRKEMEKLFGIDSEKLATSHQSSFTNIEKIAGKIMKITQYYGITIVLKGPIDIIVGNASWYYSPGGNAGLTKGGTGDVLAGVIAALYSTTDDPLLAAAAGSFLVKRTGEELWEKNLWLYNAEDLAVQVSKTLVNILTSYLKVQEARRNK